MQTEVYRVNHRLSWLRVCEYVWHAPGSKTVNTRIKWGDGTYSTVASFKLDKSTPTVQDFINKEIYWAGQVTKLV